MHGQRISGENVAIGESWRKSEMAVSMRNEMNRNMKYNEEMKRNVKKYQHGENINQKWRKMALFEMAING
jgi:hypothetical protein